MVTLKDCEQRGEIVNRFKVHQRCHFDICVPGKLDMGFCLDSQMLQFCFSDPQSSCQILVDMCSGKMFEKTSMSFKLGKFSKITLSSSSGFNHKSQELMMPKSHGER